MSDPPLVLGIDTSCDDTGVGLARGDHVLANVVIPQTALHDRYGGVMPELASREHLQVIDEAVHQALSEARLTLSDVAAVAATHGPGLVGALLVGLSYGKSLAWGLNVPFLPVHHLQGHLAAATGVEPPFLALIASGGHTALFAVHDWTRIEELGRSRDDAAGEAFDKVGRLLDLPYPGGPHIDRLARQGDRTAIRFPRGLTAGKDKERYRYDFSFSGLKTAVARYVESLEDEGTPLPREDIAASFSEAVNDVLTRKALEACRVNGAHTLVIGGGFSANSRLRELVQERAQEYGITVRIPPIRFCTDNGAMIAALGSALVRAGVEPSPLDFGNDSGMSLSQSVVQP